LVGLSIAYFVGNAEAILHPGTRVSDWAVNALYIERAGRFHELLGPYSRFHFNHPGPLSFYLLAALDKLLFFMKGDRLSLAQFLVNTTFLWIACHYLYQNLRQKAWTALLPLSLFIAIANLQTTALADIWGPNQLIVPMLAFLICLAALMRGRTDALFPLTLTAIFLTHTHIGSWALVFPLFLAGILVLWIRSRMLPDRLPRKQMRFAIRASLILAGICTLPLIVEEITSNHGNLTHLYDFFLLGKRPYGTPEPPDYHFAAVLDYVAGFFYWPVKQITGSGRAAFLMLAALLPGLIVHLMGRDKFLRSLSLICISVFVLAVPAVFASGADLGSMDYLMRFLQGNVALYFFLGMSGWGSFIMSKTPDRISMNTSFRQAGGAGLVVLTLAGGIWLSVRYLRFPPVEVPLIAELNAQIPKEHESYYLHWRYESKDVGQWEVGAALALQLTREGKKVLVPPEVEFQFGRSMTSHQLPENVFPVFLTARDTTRFEAGKWDNTLMETDFMPPESALPVRIGYQDDFRLFWSGWSGMYKDYKETNGHVARLFFRLSDSVQIGGKMELRLLAAGVGEQRLKVYVNGVPCGEQAIHQKEFAEYAWEIPPDAIRTGGGRQEIRFELPDAHYTSRFHAEKPGIRMRWLSLDFL
jgi:hypothetical protein